MPLSKPRLHVGSKSRHVLTLGILAAWASGVVLASDRIVDDPPAEAERVSYSRDVLPILRVECQGCHQPAKAGGGYAMSTRERLLQGGETGVEAIVPGHPEESYLLDQITPDDSGKVLMPKGKPALSDDQLALIERWIAEGAEVDSSGAERPVYDAENLPEYSRPPVVSSLAFSPDGSLLAVSGFHEVLLWKADGSELIGRLIGLSDRVEALAFSPDGSRLAVAAGRPSEQGEIQLWDVAKQSLDLSIPVTYDTIYGVSWSPDGTLVAVGCSDKSARAFDAKTGVQTLFMGSHDDWALDTVFSTDGSHLISVGRDGAAKLTEVATERFVDNITSITPGALKGGIAAVARHPERDEIVIGGADGVPKVYRVFRLVNRVIGDDSNIIRVLDPMLGRVHAIDVSPDGSLIAAGSGLDATGEVRVWAYDFDTTLPDEIKAIMAKVASTRSKEEADKLEAYTKQGVHQVSKLDLPGSIIYAVAFRPDGEELAVSGGDGVVRLVDPRSGSIVREFVAAPVSAEARSAIAAIPPLKDRPQEPIPTETPLPGSEVVALTVEPKAIELRGPFDYSQVLVTARLASGETIDVTRMVDPTFSTPTEVARLTRSGLLTPVADGQAVVGFHLGDQSVDLPVSISRMNESVAVDFVQDVAPALSKLGCNAGTCHGAAAGKNGFKLSLRGYDPIFDVRALSDDHASRRVNVASPSDSLMLRKPTGAAPHAGGVVMNPGEPSYEIIRRWIADGAPLDRSSARVAKIELTPSDPVVQAIGARQQVRVIATYTDGASRDVTRDAFVESGNTEVATASKSGLMTAIRRGEAPILARYEGAYAATTLTVMGDRDGFAWDQPPAWNRIDDLVAAKWERLKIAPSGLCTDEEFLRRAYLDLTGLPPTADEVRAFLADGRDTQVKRSELVDRLIGSEPFVDYWTNKWADLLQVNRKFLGVEGASAFRAWIRGEVEANRPYDEFVREIIAASGSNRDHPAASYYKVLREPDLVMENTTQLFLGIRFNCNKCHDHPFERWTQDQYYETTAYFARLGLRADPAAEGKTIGGTAVEEPKPLYEEIYDKPVGETVHIRTSEEVAPEFPFSCDYPSEGTDTRREELAAWLTSADNPYFARSYVNRLWGYMLGVGIIEPLDDIRAGNPATNPELLDYLTEEFVRHDFDPRHVMRLIGKSRTYGLSVSTNEWNEDDHANFSHANARRLPAEVLYDAVHRVVGSESDIPGVPPGTRAAALPDSGVELPSGFLDTFGRPARESSCECERSDGLQLGPVMALVSGPTLADAIADPKNELTKLVGSETDDDRLIGELFVRILNRAATEAELAACRASFEAVAETHRRLSEALGEAEVAFALDRPRLERGRAAVLDSAREALASYEADDAPKVAAEAEAKRTAAIAEAEKSLADYDAGPFAEKVAKWEAEQSTAVRWVALAPKSVEATTEATYEVLPDSSIFATGKPKKGTVTITAEVDLPTITGLRLEALPDDRLPSKGPGMASDGNFVLNEFVATVAPKADPAAAVPVKWVNPLADFSQSTFGVEEAVDGNTTVDSNGWAVSPATGVVHWATFEPEAPLDTSGGVVLTITIHHIFNDDWALGRFRLSATSLAKPIGLGLAEPLREILAVVPEIRTLEQRETLLNYHRALDADRGAKAAAIAAAKAPIPADPKLVEFKAAVTEAEKPIVPPARLVRLRADLEQSVQQAIAGRLTATQDIAWALINSPAFLFNH